MRCSEHVLKGQVHNLNRPLLTLSICTRAGGLKNRTSKWSPFSSFFHPFPLTHPRLPRFAPLQRDPSCHRKSGMRATRSSCCKQQATKTQLLLICVVGADHSKAERMSPAACSKAAFCSFWVLASVNVFDFT